MKTIAVLVSGEGTNLQALIDAFEQGKIKHGKIDLVISSNSNAFALKRAAKHNIKHVIVEHKNKTKTMFDNELFEILKKSNPNLIVLAGFVHILPNTVVNYFKNKIINIHPSLIPAFSGVGFYGIRVHQQAIERGVKISGATVHFVNEIADGGPIIAQQSVPVLNTDTAETLQKKIMEQIEWKLLPKTVEWFCADKIKLENKKVIVEGV